MDKTVFFGNGLNRLLKSNISWNDLLAKIKGSNNFKNDDLPNTMIYERIVLQKLSKYDDILNDEFDVKMEIADLLDGIDGDQIYQELYKSNIQHYITTNYDYGFLKSIRIMPEVNEIHEYSTEDVYSIRRRKRISNIQEAEKNFWQIHGEINKPATIMLGLDQYCGSIGKLNDYVKGAYKYQLEGNTVNEPSMEEKLRQNEFTKSSWIELFFASDMHIVGFSFDFSESDLWWLLIRRARMKRTLRTSGFVKNSIHFYCDTIEDSKKALLESLLVKVHVLPLGKGDDRYTEYYRSIIKSIQA